MVKGSQFQEKTEKCGGGGRGAERKNGEKLQIRKIGKSDDSEKMCK